MEPATRVLSGREEGPDGWEDSEGRIQMVCEVVSVLT